MSARKLTWTELTQLGVLILSSFGGFLLPPPSFLEPSTRAWPTHFIVAVTGGLLVVAGRRWRRNADTPMWVGVALGSLVAALIGLVAHRLLIETWTCRYYGEVYITGSDLTPYAAEYSSEHPLHSCEELLKTFTGRRAEIWTRASLVRNELLLVLSYVAVVPLLAACAIATLQAVSCSRRRSEPPEQRNPAGATPAAPPR
jgi:hypothetical protein